MPKRSCCLDKIDRTVRSKWHNTTHMLNCNVDWWSLLTRSRVGLTLGVLVQGAGYFRLHIAVLNLFLDLALCGLKLLEKSSLMSEMVKNRECPFLEWVRQTLQNLYFFPLAWTWRFPFTSLCPGFTKLHISLPRFTFMINQHFLILEYQVFKCCILFKKGKRIRDDC